jgi:hypothetical protein
MVLVTSMRHRERTAELPGQGVVHCLRGVPAPAVAGSIGRGPDSASRWSGLIGGNQIVDNADAPEIGGSTLGVSDDDPYFFPGHTVNQPDLLSQLEGAGKT